MTLTTTTDHPIRSCVQQLQDLLAGVSGVQSVYMNTDDKASVLVELSRLEAQIAELRMRVLAVAGDVADRDGARDVSTWLAHQIQAEPRQVRAELELAKSLDDRSPGVAAGMAAGEVSTAHARVILDALDRLRASTEVEPEIVEKAEHQLVAWAGEFRPSQLRTLGRRILEVIAPDIADAEEARRLQAEEEHAHSAARLSFRPLGDGTTKIHGLLPDLVATRLETYLQAYTNPRKHQDASQGALDERDRWPQSRRYAHALGALLEHLDPHQLPHHGGDATTLMITMSLDQLRADLATADILTNHDHDRLTAAQARRLACTANLIPTVLGGKSEVLDLGRTKRLFTPAQRKAIRLRDRGCRADGCSVPAAWTEAHHLKPWSTGGRTDLANAISLCNHHHHIIHNPAYAHTRQPDGTITFHRRT